MAFAVANMFAQNPLVSTPLIDAIRHNNIKRVMQRIKAGDNVRERLASGETALYWAIERGNYQHDNLPFVKVLLQAGVDPDEVEVFRMSALEISLSRTYSNPSVTLLLLEFGAQVSHACPNEGDSLVSLATQESSLDVMRALLEKGASPNCLFGESPLHWAALNGQVDRAALLLKFGADPFQRDIKDKTPLDVAICTNPDREVQKSFMQMREILRKAMQKRSSSAEE